MDEQYIVWKDERSASVREIWLKALAKHERLVKRYYDIFDKYLDHQTTHEQLCNARHDREVASAEAYTALTDYEETLARLTYKKFQEETGIQNELSEQEGQ